MSNEAKACSLGLAAIILGSSFVAEAGTTNSKNPFTSQTLTTVSTQKHDEPLTVSLRPPHPGCLAGAISKSDPRCN